MDFINPLNIYGLLVEYSASWINFICFIIRALSLFFLLNPQHAPLP